MRVAIIGCGLIGQKRVRALAGATLAVCCDVKFPLAEKLAAGFAGARATADWREAATAFDVEIVVVATIHKELAPIAATAAAAGKHVLVEKPGARRAAELDPVLEAAAATGARVRVGFNHRFHPALQKARELVDSGVLGPLLFVRGRYGHGGRPGYDKEWRAVEELSGGGEAIDQGLHLIDLARWFLGDFNGVQGHVATYFWDMPVEDNAFFLLTTPGNQTAQLHASWTEWKNLFSLEIYGRDGKLDISGLGGSYGVERLAYYKMLPEMGPPETVIWEYPSLADRSWELEFAAFLRDIAEGREPEPGVRDAQAALRIVETIYKERGR
ncbi:MAG: Gfo/Idh/MocA family protein [Bryobacteraceae bacterium]